MSIARNDRTARLGELGRMIRGTSAGIGTGPRTKGASGVKQINVILFCTQFRAQNIASRLKRRLNRKVEEVEEVEENVKAGCLSSIKTL
jgi:hypothetical protein